MDTVDAYGLRFLKCAKDDCRWNVGYTPSDLNRSGLEFTYRIGAGIRVCNFGSKALAYGGTIDPDCPHRAELCDLLAEDDGTFQSRFWGTIDPDVARKALGAGPERD